MFEKSNQIHDQLAAIRAQFLENLPERLTLIRTLFEELSKEWNAEKASELYIQLHSITGSGSTFGFPELTENAYEGEILLKPSYTTGEPATPHHWNQLGEAITGMERLLSRLKNIKFMGKTDLPPTRHRAVKEDASPLIYIATVDAGLSGNLSFQLECQGYQVACFQQLSALSEALKKLPPDALVLDQVMPDEDPAEHFRRLQQERQPPTYPLLFVSDEDTMDARLRAIRAGGKAFFPKPIPFVHFIERLDLLTGREHVEPYRVLIIDDSRTLAQYYATVLEHAGMRTSIVGDPFDALSTISSFRPELILMDLYMPGCSGKELVELLRQYDDFLSIPIIFLSAEFDGDIQRKALQQGGDDFLTKPISADRLVQTVLNRVQRGRLLRDIMVRDSMTGLLSHAECLQRLDLEVARAKRTSESLVVAMIDLDHFKKVNDTYGHAVGDVVIKSLCRLLKRRLRKTDIIGRYGGEEFLVGLLDVSRETGMRILEEIRETFGKVIHQAESQSFTATLSCGMATFPETGTAQELLERADEALYEAKSRGRNQLCPWSPSTREGDPA